MSSRLTSESRIYADKARDLNRQVSFIGLMHIKYMRIIQLNSLVCGILMSILLLKWFGAQICLWSHVCVSYETVFKNKNLCNVIFPFLVLQSLQFCDTTFLITPCAGFNFFELQPGIHAYILHFGVCIYVKNPWLIMLIDIVRTPTRYGQSPALVYYLCL